MSVWSFGPPLLSSYILASICLCPGAYIQGSCLNAKKLDWKECLLVGQPNGLAVMSHSLLVYFSPA